MSEDAIKKRYWLLASIFLIAFLAIPISGLVVNQDAATRGQWGDFFGGTLNPLLTFLTFVGLLYTIYLQQKELRLSRAELSLTREELKRSSDALESQNESLAQQRFENTLFSMIAVLNQIIEKMDVVSSPGYGYEAKAYNGRDCFSHFKSELERHYKFRSWSDDPIYEEQRDFDDPYELIEYPHDEDRIKQAYVFFHKEHRSDLGHYFRVLYNIFRFIDESDYKNPIYQKILRAQLSNQELFVIFYNCSSEFGLKFSSLASKFVIFDNLLVEDLIRPEHLALVPRASFGDS